MVTAIKGSNTNLPGNGHETIMALNLSSRATKVGYFYENTLDIGTAENLINKKRPFIPVMFEKGTNMGHTLVCTGYSESTDEVRIVNPWPGVGNQNYSYNNLLSGITLDNGNFKYVATITYS